MWSWEFIRSNAQELVVVFTFFGSLAVIITALLVVYQLSVLKRSQKLESALTFLRLMKEGSEDRKFVYKQMPEDCQSLSQLSAEDQRKIEGCISILNDVGLLLEERTIPKELFFSIYHTMVIRVCHKLKYYVKYREPRIGGRYGNRLNRLDERAKLYHDIHPMHRQTTIMLDTGTGAPGEIYKTYKLKSFCGVLQKIVWFFRRKLRIY